MRTFQDWLMLHEDKNDNTYYLDAVMDFAAAIKRIFKNYSKSTREKAWHTITSKKGENEVNKLLREPDRKISSFRTL